MGVRAENAIRLEGLRQTVDTRRLRDIVSYVDTHYPERFPTRATSVLGTFVAQLNDSIDTLDPESSDTEKKLRNILVQRRNTVAGLIVSGHKYIAEKVSRNELRKGIKGYDPMIVNDLRQEALMAILELALKYDPRINESEGTSDGFLPRAWALSRYRVHQIFADELGLETQALNKMEIVSKASKDNHGDAYSRIAYLLSKEENAPFDHNLYGQLMYIIFSYPIVNYGLALPDASTPEEIVMAQETQADIIEHIRTLLFNREPLGKMNSREQHELKIAYAQQGGEVRQRLPIRNNEYILDQSYRKARRYLRDQGIR